MSLHTPPHTPHLPASLPRPHPPRRRHADMERGPDRKPRQQRRHQVQCDEADAEIRQYRNRH
jgi:hypothetical protein